MRETSSVKKCKGNVHVNLFWNFDIYGIDVSPFLLENGIECR